MIRFGPSGIPLSCKGRTLKDGIEDVHTLGLSAMEVQLVRTNLNERYVLEEEVGRSPKDIEDELVVEIIRRKKIISDMDTKLKGDDMLVTLTSGIARDLGELATLGEIAKNLDVQLSIHTPYYMDLLAEDVAEGSGTRSMDSIKWSGTLAKEMEGVMVVTHLGLYSELSKKAAFDRVLRNVGSLVDWFQDNGIKAKLGLEASGKQDVFGSLNELLKVCKEIDGTHPVLNFAHIHARDGGSLKGVEDFQKVLDKALSISPDWLYTHFSGVEHFSGNERRLTPIKKGDMRFEHLAEAILDSAVDMTVISDSPLVEHDAMYMKVILERVLTRREAKAMRAKTAKEEADLKEAEEEKPAKKKAEPKKSAAKPKKEPPKKKPVKKKAEPKKSAAKPKKKVTKKKAPKKKPAKKKVAKKKTTKKKQVKKKASKKKAAKKKTTKKKQAKKKVAKKKTTKKKQVKKKATKKKTTKKKTAKKKPSKKRGPKKKAAKKKVTKKKQVKKKAPKKKAAKKKTTKKKQVKKNPPKKKATKKKQARKKVAKKKTTKKKAAKKTTRRAKR